ncbi:MAG: DUF2207 domain-containing protein [Sphingomonas sp.]|nr:DUF2207 domain-containing protein [Sphingomonas sp.]
MRGLFALFLALFALAAPAAADERILAWNSDFFIAENGVMTVTERIRVRSENNRIRRGIFRDLPTRYATDHGGTIKVGFEFIGAERNGRAESYSLDRMSNGLRIKVGDPEVFIGAGEHEYVLRYRIKRAIGFFDGYDELYWNVTGSGWAFPIDSARATVRLPEPVELGQAAVHTGPQGSRASDAEVIAREPGIIRFATTRTLAPREGFTIAVAFPKGIVSPPTETELQVRRIAEFAAPIGGLLGILLIFGYYYVAWKKAGRDPRPGTVVPLFAPPDDMSPAAMRYVTKQRMDNRGFAAAMVNAAVKGHVRLVEEGGSFFGLAKGKTHIERLEGPTARPLEDGERRMLDRLVPIGESITIDQENHADFRAAMKKLGKPHEKRFDGAAFNRNIGWAVGGVAFVVLGAWMGAAGTVWAEDAASPLYLLLTVSGLAITGLLFFAMPEKGTALRWPILLIASATAVASTLGALPMLPIAMSTGNALPVLVPLFVGGLMWLGGFFWMSAPTVEGRALLDRIAGFKRYLSTTEQERFDRMQPASEDLQLFERYLPYAIALGVENKWAKRFESKLLAAANDPGRVDRGFYWYSGTQNVWDNPAKFATAIGSSMASSIASASTAPGSSSGSGGGGFSGGGGGGGGGGGW